MANERLDLAQEVQKSVDECLGTLTTMAMAAEKRSAELQAISFDIDRQAEKIRETQKLILARLGNFVDRERQVIESELKSQAEVYNNGQTA